MTESMPVEYVDAFFSFFVDGTIDETTVQPTVREVLGREPRLRRLGRYTPGEVPMTIDPLTGSRPASTRSSQPPERSRM